jgi:hypothetical protein
MLVVGLMAATMTTSTHIGCGGGATQPTTPQAVQRPAQPPTPRPAAQPAPAPISRLVAAAREFDDLGIEVVKGDPALDVQKSPFRVTLPVSLMGGEVLDTLKADTESATKQDVTILSARFYAADDNSKIESVVIRFVCSKTKQLRSTELAATGRAANAATFEAWLKDHASQIEKAVDEARLTGRGRYTPPTTTALPGRAPTRPTIQ